MNPRTYKHIKGFKLAHFYTVEIQDFTEKDSRGMECVSKKAFLTSTIHTNKRMECPNSWSTSFSDEEILKDHLLLSFVKRSVGEPFALTEYVPPA